MYISDEIIKILNYLCEKLGIVINWTDTNVIPYIELLCAKFIKWEIATSIVWIVIGAILIVAGSLSLKRLMKYCDEFGKVASLVIFILIIVIAFIVIIVQVFDIVECLTFPEKVIYEYIQTQLKIQTN